MPRDLWRIAGAALIAVLLAGCDVHEGMWIHQPGEAPQSASASDADGDGVLDENDECPGTPAGVRVNPDGCPRDDDRDGVPNYKDECPRTTEGVAVDAVGCPRDDDNDGVPNFRDECPDTPPGREVDERGCALEQALNAMDPVHFEVDKARLRPSARDILREVADRLDERPEVRVRVIGHTDSTNTWDYNMDLSQRRAEAVVSFLVEQGIDPDRLVPVGRGESEPVATNETETGRAQNRRVEYRVIEG